MKKTLLTAFLLAGAAPLLHAQAQTTFLHAPHDAAHGIGCVDCHEFTLTDVDSWEAPQDTLDDTVKNFICLRCHGPAGSAPAVGMHSDLTVNGTETWSNECTDCHAPHFQRQLAGVADISEDFLLTDMYLVTGTINSVTTAGGNTTITYTLGYAAADWTNPGRWSAKTAPDRGLIFVADALNPKGVTYETILADASSITVAGIVASDMVGKTFGLFYGQFLRKEIKTPFGNQIISFFNPHGGFVDDSGSITPTGVCQVCHSNTGYWTYDGSNNTHNSQTNCLICHEHEAGFAPGAGGAGGKHPGHLLLAGVTCGTCHDTNNFPYFHSGTDANGDGMFDLAETNVCDACHQDAIGNALSGYAENWLDDGFELDCSSCHALSPSTGSHTVHLSLTECGSCHDSAVQGTTAPEQHVDTNIDVYDTVPADQGYPADKEKFTPPSTCNNLYCHSSAQGSVNPTDAPTYMETPVWGTPFSNTVATCTGCHNSGGHLGGAGTPMATGSHAKHLSYKFDQDASCQVCHFDWNYTGCVNCHNRRVSHVDGNIDVTFSESFPFGVTASSGNYSGDPSPQTDYGGCDSLFCHSQGTSASAPYTPPNVTDITWGGAAMPSDCSGCHGGDPASAVPINTGSHSRHTADYDCSVCHDRTVSNSRTLNQTPYSSYTYGQRYHVDGKITVAFESAVATNGTYAGQSSPVIYRQAGSSYGACGNIYCHSNGTSVATGTIPSYTSAVWGSGGPLACDSCHAYGPDYPNGSPKANSHQVHGSNNCQYCHAATTATGNSITSQANHVNGVYDVEAGGGVSFTYSGGTCSNISCHQGGHADWGSTTLAMDCDSCHGYPPVPGDGLNVNDQFDGGKGAHITASYDPSNGIEGGHIIVSSDLNPSADIYGSDATGYFECSKCHYGGAHANGSVEVNIRTSAWSKSVPWGSGSYDRTDGFNQEPTLTAYQGEPGNSVTPKTCSNINCHFGTETPRWSCPGGE
ncbi:MAG: CxxxxCH/CxxCH domain-containing protein [Desulfobulbaceae bacterium]|nr:CxxxxCH/CxxCH domain-containing protein [Desulfobulbaceae bacterium]